VENLVAIGRFAHLTGLTAKALRLYDQRGLLEPAVVDFQTGFRYYRLAQVPTATRIRLLRTFDMPLAEIHAVLTAPDAATERRLLARQRRRLEQHLASSQRALETLRALEDGCERTRKEQSMEKEHEAKAYCCSFCGKANTAVKRMIAGPNGVFICSECVTLCNDIIAKKEQAPEATAS
jgi:DNA-binding transcriptional MerR regulator